MSKIQKQDTQNRKINNPLKKYKVISNQRNHPDIGTTDKKIKITIINIVKPPGEKVQHMQKKMSSQERESKKLPIESDRKNVIWEMKNALNMLISISDTGLDRNTELSGRSIGMT